MNINYDKTNKKYRGYTRRELLAFGTTALATVPFLTLAERIGSSSEKGAGREKEVEEELTANQDKKMRIGVIGAGWLSGTVGGLLVKAGHEVMFSSRHPEELKPLAGKLGKLASVGTPQEAAAFGTVLLFAVPYDAIPQLGIDLKDLIKGKIVLDACNGGSGDLGKEVDANGAGPTTSKYLVGARVLRVFSSEDATSIEASSKRTTEKLAIPIAGNDKEGLSIASQLVRDAGCDPVVVGDLSTGVKFQRRAPAFRVNATAPELRRILGVEGRK